MALDESPQLIHVKRSNSFVLSELVEAVGAEAYTVTGLRAGEKMHETLVGKHELDRAYEDDKCIRIVSDTPWDDKLPAPRGRRRAVPYSSDINTTWSVEGLRGLL